MRVSIRWGRIGWSSCFRKSTAHTSFNFHFPLLSWLGDVLHSSNNRLRFWEKWPLSRWHGPKESKITRLVLEVACTEYKLKPRPGMYETSVSVRHTAGHPWKSMSTLPTYSTWKCCFIPDRNGFTTGERGPNIIHVRLVHQMTWRTTLSNPYMTLIKRLFCKMNALCKQASGMAIFSMELLLLRSAQCCTRRTSHLVD